MRDFRVRLAQRVLERERVGRAVALDHHALEPDQRRAVVAARVDASLERVQSRQRGERDHLAKDVPGKFLAQEIAEHLRESLRSLERDVADESIADDDVGRALVDVVALDIAVEVEVGCFQQLGGLLDHIVALDVFLADVEQADRGPLDAVHRGHQRAAHHRELQELLGVQLTLAPRSSTVVTPRRRRQL